MREQKITLVTVLLLVICGTVWAQPSWDNNPNRYVYSMTLTGKVKVDGIPSVDENDVVAAFIDSECRGIAHVNYQSALDEYFVFLMIYSNDPSGVVSLKIYDASTDKEIDVAGTFNFVVNDIVGSVSSPFDFTVLTQTYSSKILSFTVPNQDGGTSINANSVTLKISLDSDITSLIPTFTLSEGAKAYVDGVEQESGVSTHDFRGYVIYKVVSQLGVEQKYFVDITNGTTSATRIRLLNSTVPENTDSVLVGTLDVQSSVIGSTYTFSLVDASGVDNELFYLKDEKLYAIGSFNYELKSEYKVNVKVDNNKGVARQELLVIRVMDKNDAPTGLALSTKSLSETTVLSKIVARLTTEDEDVNDVHSYRLLTGDGNNDNSYFSVIGDSLQLVKTIGDFQQDSVRILLEVTDGEGASLEKTWSFTLVDINYAPNFRSTPLNYAIQNQVYVYPVLAEDNEGDIVSYSFDGLPTWLVFNEQTSLLSGVPNNEHVGLVQFVIEASDGNRVSSQAVVISVLNINDAPEINSYPGTQFFRVGNENAVSLPGNCIVDPDEGDVLSFSLSSENNSNLPDWLSFDKETLTLSGNPTEEHIGKYNLKLTAIDRGRLKEWLVFTLDVTLPTAIDDTYSNSKFKLYPNPVKQRLHLGIPQGEAAEISIHNLHGQLIRKLELNGGTLSTVMVEALVPGIYLVKFHQGKNTYVEQIIKQ